MKLSNPCSRDVTPAIFDRIKNAPLLKNIWRKTLLNLFKCALARKYGNQGEQSLSNWTSHHSNRRLSTSFSKA
uniref:Uncharacterized protein n=1 Tax=Haemonchus contortus TaxID=6289 RepID=W6NA16_HAECO